MSEKRFEKVCDHIDKVIKKMPFEQKAKAKRMAYSQIAIGYVNHLSKDDK